MVLTATHSEPRCSIIMPGRISLPLSLATPAFPVFRGNGDVPRCAAGFVARYAHAVVERDGIFDLAVHIAGTRCGGEPSCGFGRVLRHAAPFLIERGKRVLGFRIARLGGGAEQLGGALEVLWELLAFEIEQAEVIGRAEMARLGGAG